MMLPDREDVLSAMWAVASPPWDDLDFKIAEARYWWDQYGYFATWTVASATLHAVHGFARTLEVPEGYHRRLEAPAPPDEVLARLGSPARAREIARMTWEVVAGVAMSDAIGVDDPLLEKQLRAVDANAKGSGVYMFGWWCHEAIAETSIRRGDADLSLAAMEVYGLMRLEVGRPREPG